MIKKLIGIVVLASLAIILVINVVKLNEEKEAESTGPNLVDVTGDTSVKGVAIVPPNAVSFNVGDVAPDFELPLLNGEMVKLSDLKGQKVLVNFWASWCGPCKMEMPELEKFYKDYGDEIKIIAINATDSERSEQAVRDFIKENKYTFPIVLDKKMDVTDKEYQVLSLPTSYFIGTDGTFQAPRHVGPMTYDFMVDTFESLN